MKMQLWAYAENSVSALLGEMVLRCGFARCMHRSRLADAARRAVEDIPSTRATDGATDSSDAEAQ
jgi:hypothetical protein